MSAVDLWEKASAAGAPLVSPVTAQGLVEVTFVWRGEAASTSVGWGQQHPLRRSPGTDVWHATLRLPATMRTIYYLSHLPPDAYQAPRDDSGVSPESHVDPLNPQRLLFPGDPGDPSDKDAWASMLTLPLAKPERWSLPEPGVPAGTLEQVNLDGGRRAGVYRPPGEHRAGRPVVVVFDGYLGRTMMRMPTTIDNLIAAGRIPPLVAIFVDGHDATRNEDLAPTSEATAHFVTHELMPWARKELGVSPYPADVALAGMSLGGLAAAHLALREPSVFGGVISHSGSFWWPWAQHGEPELLTREVARRPRSDVRFYLDVGDRETFVVTPGNPQQVEVNRRFRDALRARGYEVTYAEYPGEHDYVNWRNTFADGLIAIFGKG
ncbi:alpha/beta hydrolase-fold protein [Actinoplanes sp. NPDC051494]|uniref:alpha/beta hydrolase-fold protein n=1 Tax=Actinoplanes sp. NPDC051494 TaxID=3363907 RepID=UPI00378CEE58